MHKHFVYISQNCFTQKSRQQVEPLPFNHLNYWHETGISKIFFVCEPLGVETGYVWLGRVPYFVQTTLSEVILLKIPPAYIHDSTLSIILFKNSGTLQHPEIFDFDVYSIDFPWSYL